MTFVEHRPAHPLLSGKVDEPDHLLRLLHFLAQCGVSGRLETRTRGPLTLIFTDSGRVVKVVRGQERGAAALNDALCAGSSLTFDLYPWSTPPGAKEDGEDVLAQMAEPAIQRRRLKAMLVMQVGKQIHSPIDALEVTAVLESLGITDEVASERYACSDVFALAEDVLDGLWRSAHAERD
jgi:hypothetical protein